MFYFLLLRGRIKSVRYYSDPLHPHGGSGAWLVSVSTSKTGGLWLVSSWFPLLLRVHTNSAACLLLVDLNFNLHGNAINVLSALLWWGQRTPFSDSSPLQSRQCSWGILTLLVTLTHVFSNVWCPGSGPSAFSGFFTSMSILNSWGSWQGLLAPVGLGKTGKELRERLVLCFPHQPFSTGESVF